MQKGIDSADFNVRAFCFLLDKFGEIFHRAAPADLFDKIINAVHCARFITAEDVNFIPFNTQDIGILFMRYAESVFKSQLFI